MRRPACTFPCRSTGKNHSIGACEASSRYLKMNASRILSYPATTFVIRRNFPRRDLSRVK